MDLEEIEQKIYINTMRLKSIEANFENVAPYSSEFDSLMGKVVLCQDLVQVKMSFSSS